MKTVKEVAQTANVSKTSVYNLIKKYNIPTFKRSGKTLLDESGQNLVIGYYSTEQYETISDIITDTKLEITKLEAAKSKSSGESKNQETKNQESKNQETKNQEIKNEENGNRKDMNQESENQGGENQESENQENEIVEYAKVINILEDERSEKNKIIRDLLQSNTVLSQALAANKMNETAKLIINDNLYVKDEKLDRFDKSKGIFGKLFKRKSVSHK